MSTLSESCACQTRPSDIAIRLDSRELIVVDLASKATSSRGIVSPCVSFMPLKQIWKVIVSMVKDLAQPYAKHML